MPQTINAISAIFTSLEAPSGMWANLINGIHSWVGSYGWTVLVLIIFVKLVLSPLDYLTKHTSKKQALVQQKTAPQLAKLRKKYGENQQMMQQQTQALYKKEGFNMFTSCIVMLLNMVITCVIFFTLFAGLRNMSSYQALNQYKELHGAYVASVEKTMTDEGYSEGYQKYVELFNKNKLNQQDSETNPALTDEEKALITLAYNNAKVAVQDKWNDVKDDWLWIQNIWVKDGHASPLPSLSNLSTMANNSKNSEYIAAVASIADGDIEEQNYVLIAASIQEKTGSWNGYYLLAIISVLLAVLSQFINDLTNKAKNKRAQKLVDAANPQAKSMIIMKLAIPLVMGIFVLSTNAAFGIYVVTNSTMSTLIGLATGYIVSLVFKKKQDAVNEYLEKETGKMYKKSLNNKGEK